MGDPPTLKMSNYLLSGLEHSSEYGRDSTFMLNQPLICVSAYFSFFSVCSDDNQCTNAKCKINCNVNAAPCFYSCQCHISGYVLNPNDPRECINEGMLLY